MKFNNAFLVLAAGAASRMGNPKQLLNWKGKPMVQSVLQTCAELPHEQVFCVVGAHLEQVAAVVAETGTAKLIVNNEWEKGIGSSIVTGLKSIQQSNPAVTHVTILLGDQPCINTSILEVLIHNSQQSPNYIVACKYPNGVGVPAIFPSAVFKLMEKLNSTLGAKKLIASYPKVKSVEVPSNLLFDIDTPADYKKACHESAQG